MMNTDLLIVMNISLFVAVAVGLIGWAARGIQSDVKNMKQLYDARLEKYETEAEVNRNLIKTLMSRVYGSGDGTQFR